MTNEDRILFELRFSYQGLNDEEGDYYIDLIRHIKEVTDSEYVIKGSSNSSFDLVTFALRKLPNGEVSFNGAIGNEDENKWVDGVIKTIGSKVYVSSEITPLHESITDKRSYNTVDYFNSKGSKVIRKTSYSDGKYYEEELEPFDKTKLDEYLQDKVNGMKSISR